jgi:hypothetical protein
MVLNLDKCGLQATDADGPGPNSIITYSLQQSSLSSNFTLHNSTQGVELRLGSPLNYEALPPGIVGGEITLVLIATDGGSTTMSGSVSITVTVQVSPAFYSTALLQSKYVRFS